MNGSNKGIYSSNVEVLNQGLRPLEYWRVRTRRVLRAWQEGTSGGGYPTGLTALDDFIRLVPGELTILAARPGMGKSALALQIACNMTADNNDPGDRIAVFSAEMSGWSLYMRMACGMAEVNMFDLRARRATPDMYKRVDEAILSLDSMPLLIDDRSSPSVEYMGKEIALLGEAYNVRGMVFDFMELVSTDTPHIHGEQAMSNAAKALKALAKEHDIPVLAISHLNREVEERKSKIPELSDLRYSGMIEQIADTVLLMVRPTYYVEKGMKIDTGVFEKLALDGDVSGSTNVEDTAYIFVAKNRNGRTGVTRLAYDAPRMTFYDIKRTPLPQVMA